MSATDGSRRSIHVEITERDYLALLKGAAKGSSIGASLAAAPEGSRKRGGSSVYLFQGSRGEALLLRALALLHAPATVKAIDNAMKEPAK